MKRVNKSEAPQALKEFIANNPNATWEQMCDDDKHNTYRECREQAVNDQYGLCAYCESRISPDVPNRCNIEHFHPKSDKNGIHNWGLDWQNMIAVCDGGRVSTPEKRTSHPLPERLSCDAHKDRMIQLNNLPEACEGKILNPIDDAPAFPNIFSMDKGTGHYKPNEDACSEVNISDNSYATVSELVTQTINMLNLNCSRLTEKRRQLVVNIDRNKKSLRLRNTPRDKASEMLIARYFGVKWPEYFTAIRCCLGQAAEDYLHSVGYQG